MIVVLSEVDIGPASNRNVRPPAQQNEPGALLTLPDKPWKLYVRYCRLGHPGA